ncbi:MAG: hypothetical protein IT306_29230 [Chloroflexi bacterium]|nr:hypothetical protein [Chloroflexota bacterium]
MSEGSSFTIRGVAGRLKAGSHLAAEIHGWTAVRQPDGRWRISAERHTPDAYWLENGTTFKAVLQVGKSEQLGRAEILSLSPLVFNMEIS